MKIDLDKYYTPIELSKRLIDLTYQVIGKANITEVIEPSAGDGSFSLQIPNCIAYDIAPEHPSIIKQDFLTLDLPYKEGRLVIGNPPFGRTLCLAVKFGAKSFAIADYVAFILPVSQYDNNLKFYKFDLIYSEVLDTAKYSGVEVPCVFNIFKRPANGLRVSPKNYKLKDVTIYGYRRGTRFENLGFDIGICGWGSSTGNPLGNIGQFAQEFWLIIHNRSLRERVIEVMLNTNWKTLYPQTLKNSAKLQAWKIYKHLYENVEGIR